MNPIDMLHKLQDELRKRAAALGLEMHQTLWHPGQDKTDPTIMTAYFHINPEAVFTEDDKIDKEFESIIGQLDDEGPTIPQRNQDLKEKMERDLREGKGLFGD